MDGFSSMFAGFGSSDDFFNVPKKKPDAKSEAKKETAKKDVSKKAAAGKGKKQSNFDCDVTLPVTVKARAFETIVEGEGSMKLSALAKKLVDDGYSQLELSNMGLIYLKDANMAYVVDSQILASDDESQVDLTDGKTVTVIDGQFKAEFSLSDFEGKDEDEVSLKDVAERFAKINPGYSGCRLFYEKETGLAYPVLEKVLGTQKLDGDITVVVNGSSVLYGESEAEDISSLLKKICGEGVEAVMYKADDTYFVSYGKGKNNCYTKNGSSVVAQKIEKVEKKYALPLDLYVVTWNMHYELTSEMFGGAEKVTTEQITKVMAKSEKMFADKDRKIDYLYHEEKNLMSCMFISGKKGAYADAHTGIWKIIRSKKELDECRQMDQYCGLYHEDGENFQLLVLPHGNFYGYFGRELECCTVKSIQFERKLPKIERSVLDHIIEYFRSDLSKEMAVRILYNRKTEEFLYVAAEGEKKKASIEYDYSAQRALMAMDNVLSVMEIHSHNTMPAFFSRTDDEDEQAPGIYGVVGELDKASPSIKFRAGFRGVFKEVPLSELFECPEFH